MTDWGLYLTAMTLALTRLSAMVAFAPFFSSASLPARTKAAFVLATAFLLAPTVAAQAGARPSLSYGALLGEVAVGLTYGLSLALLNEMMLFAGQIVGMQFSFSLVNLLDPNTSIQTPLMSNLFQLLGALALLAAGLDRILLASLVRSFHAAPLGGYSLTQATALALIRSASGLFLAALELAAPVLAATMLVEIAISLLGKISPQLPVMNLTVPGKTLTGFALLCGALALWPRFVEARFASLLDMAERMLTSGGR